MSASGRVCEITNGRFVEAKHEKRWLAVRLLRSKPAGRFGSGVPVRRRRQRSFNRPRQASCLRVGCKSSSGYSTRQVGARPMTPERRTPCIEAPGATGSNRGRPDTRNGSTGASRPAGVLTHAGAASPCTTPAAEPTGRLRALAGGEHALRIASSSVPSRAQASRFSALYGWVR